MTRALQALRASVTDSCMLTLRSGEIRVCETLMRPPSRSDADQLPLSSCGDGAGGLRGASLARGTVAAGARTTAVERCGFAAEKRTCAATGVRAQIAPQTRRARM